MLRAGPRIEDVGKHRVEVVTKAHRKRVMRMDPQRRKPPRFRISGVTAEITTLQEAEVLDLSLEGALVEHQGGLHLGSPCFLQLGIAGERLSIRCRVVHSQVSRKEAGGALYYQTGLEFVRLPRGAEQILGALIRSYGAAEG
jgi:hypothetical protein